jgi:hypothetical protein
MASLSSERFRRSDERYEAGTRNEYGEDGVFMVWRVHPAPQDEPFHSGMLARGEWNDFRDNPTNINI